LVREAAFGKMPRYQAPLKIPAPLAPYNTAPARGPEREGRPRAPLLRDKVGKARFR